MRQAKDTTEEREEKDSEHLVRPAPKLKPSRHDKKRERVQGDKDPDLDKSDTDTSMNYKTIGGSISTYPRSRSMDKSALYHGVDPRDHYPAGPREGWSQPSTRTVGEDQYEIILANAREWLRSPLLTHGVDGMVPDQMYRHALDLGIGLYAKAIETRVYNMLLARLQGVEEPGLGKSGIPTFRIASDRSRLEKAVYERFSPDSRMKSGGALRVMLTGDSAKVLRRDDYETVALADLSDAEIQKLASLFRIKTAVSIDNTLGDTTPFTVKDHQETLSMKLTTKQANETLERLDKLANHVQANHKTWGMPFDAARALVNAIDKTADEIEGLAFGEQSFQRRQAEVAVTDRRLASVMRSEIGRLAFEKAAKVLQRDADEPYMDTFENRMKPHETDADESYMNAYSDDQDISVAEGESEEGRELAPEYDGGFGS